MKTILLNVFLFLFTSLVSGRSYKYVEEINNSNFDVNRFLQLPTITTISPNPVFAGEPFTIFGTNLGSATLVTVGGVQYFEFAPTATSITLTVSNGGQVKVFTPDGTATSPVDLFVFQCMPPKTLSQTNITSTSVNLHWSAVPGITNYKLNFKQLHGDEVSYNTTRLDTVISGLTPATTYQWSVSINCPPGPGANEYRSTPNLFTTAGHFTCDPPTVLTAVNTGTEIMLNWSVAPNALFYQVRYKGASGSWINLNQVFGESTSLEISNLIPGTNYMWQVRSACISGQLGNWTKSSSFTTAPCLPPVNLSASNITLNSAQLNFTVNTMPYNVEYWVSGNTVKLTTNFFFQDPPYILQGLQPGTTYFWRVNAFCNPGVVSEFSKTAKFKTATNAKMGISYDTDAFSEAEAFPNPSTGVVTVKMNSGISKLEVLDLSGKILKTKVCDGSDEELLDLTQCEKGMYYIRIISEENTVVKKVVIEK